MRKHEADRSPAPGRWHPWFKQISNAVTHVSAAALLAAGAANSLAARKINGRNDHRGRRDQASSDGDGSNHRNRGDESGNNPKEENGHQREHGHRSQGNGDGGNPDRNVKHERQVVDESRDVHAEATKTPTPTPTSTPKSDGNGGGGNGNSGDHHAGNAGSGFFDSPLATKARRRANDFDNTNQDQNQDHVGTTVDVHPDGESVYQTHSISLTTGPDGLEVATNNITFTAEPTPTPAPLPRLELPVQDSQSPFGQSFPFGNSTVVIAPTSPEPSDTGDTGTTTDPGADPIPSEPDQNNSDGGDNTMDFSS